VVADAADPEPDAVDRAIGTRLYPVRRLTGTRPGLSANRNTGMRAAKASLLLFTDNDTLAEPQLISEHLDWHRRHPGDEVAVLGHVRWAREIKVTPFMHWLDHGFQFDFPNIRGIEAGWGRFYGANVSVKRAFVETVGGFDQERMPYLYDDLDFAYRASKHGLRLLYNRRAVVEHLREMDLSYWRSRMRQVAHAEREFMRIHPELPELYPDLNPYFFRRFSAAASHPPIRGRGRHLIRLVPRRLPWLGPRVWGSADLYFRQELAPEFLKAWEEDSPESAEGPVCPLPARARSRRELKSMGFLRRAYRGVVRRSGYFWAPLLASAIRKRWVLFRNPHADIRFGRYVYLGPGFSLHMPFGGTFIAGDGAEFRRGFRCDGRARGTGGDRPAERLHLLRPDAVREGRSRSARAACSASRRWWSTATTVSAT